MSTSVLLICAAGVLNEKIIEMLGCEAKSSRSFGTSCFCCWQNTFIFHLREVIDLLAVDIPMRSVSICVPAMTSHETLMKRVP
uniref:Secreted protein n=1 Tax=Ascaris lumbricoides TaxID=6252 RepID=A0A0M3IKM2_ASCLU